MNTDSQQPETVNEATAKGELVAPTGSQLGLVITFAIYSILYEAIVWGLFGWAVFVKDRSGWWVLVALILSSAQLKPKHFGIRMDGSKNIKPNRAAK